MRIRSNIGENALFVRDELERNYVAAQSGGYHSRRANIEAMPSDIPRQIELRLLETAKDHPEAVAKLLRLHIEGTDLSYAGAGTENTAVTDGESVWKIHRKSVHWANRDRQNKAFYDREHHMVMQREMEEFIVPELTTVGRHPLRPGKWAVITRQKFYDFMPTSIFPAYESTIDERAVEYLVDEYAEITGALGRFATAGLALYEEEGLLVDSSGFNNVVMAERDGTMKLTCLDGTPVKQNNASVAERIIGQLEALHNYVM